MSRVSQNGSDYFVSRQSGKTSGGGEVRAQVWKTWAGWNMENEVWWQEHRPWYQADLGSSPSLISGWAILNKSVSLFPSLFSHQ